MKEMKLYFLFLNPDSLVNFIDNWVNAKNNISIFACSTNYQIVGKISIAPDSVSSVKIGHEEYLKTAS